MKKYVYELTASNGSLGTGEILIQVRANSEEEAIANAKKMVNRAYYTILSAYEL